MLMSPLGQLSEGMLVGRGSGKWGAFGPGCSVVHLTTGTSAGQGVGKIEQFLKLVQADR